MKLHVSIAFNPLDFRLLDGNYLPPRSDKLYDVKKLRVSPFVLLFSFKRQPQSSRYAVIRGVRGAKLTNYFTTRLKFTVDRYVRAWHYVYFLHSFHSYPFIFRPKSGASFPRLHGS